ncbi:hypothetical protein EDD71_11371 [Fonticella tunisiensis]|uniref:Uncharacterized protein n=2 Tax=Fonticella tunisiensis TaxID=1096341 RepID=A0A4R7KMA6_9CLOT|nr:hypothetical protein EDD71_11371 [Fonticella tunisiensis]
MMGRRVSLFTIIIVILGLVIAVESFLIFRSVFSIKGDNKKLKEYVLSLEDENKRLREENKLLGNKIDSFYNPKNSPPDTPEGWLTYRDLDEGFEVGYPDVCRIIVGGTEKDKKLSITSGAPDLKADINIVSLHKYKNPNEYIKEVYDYRIYVKESVYINNIKYYIYKLSGEKHYYVLLKNKTHIYDINSPSEEFLIRILGTFKFI